MMSMKKYLAICLVVILVASVFGTAIGTGVSVEDSSLSDGSVAEEDAIEIEDWYDLDEVRDDLSADYVLMNNLDEHTGGYEELVDTEEGWDPIGYYDDWDNEYIGFSGAFDGNGYEIRDLYLYRGDENDVGLFGAIDDGGKVAEVGLMGTVEGDYSINVGGLVGYNDGGSVSNSYAIGNVSARWKVGGLVGYNDGGSVSNSYAISNVSARGEVGGLVGYNDGGSVYNSYAIGNVSGIGLSVGGLVGDNNEGTVKHSYATSGVNGEGRYVGGLVGDNDKGTVKHSYATGEVSGEEYIGGLAGINNNGEVENSYSSGDVSGDRLVGGLVGWNGEGVVSNSYYNLDEVLINDEHHVTLGGLFENQYDDWIDDMSLNIEDYESTLVPSNGYYEIHSVQGIRDLLGFAEKREYSFRLTSDLDMSDHPELFIPYLKAEFDGYGHVIFDLDLNLPFASNIGMFGRVNQGSVENIGVKNVSVTGHSNVGALVGGNYDGTVSNSNAKAGSVRGTSSGRYYSSRVGGLVGLNSGTVENSYIEVVSVNGDADVGGLVGSNSGTVSDSYSKSYVTGVVVGGLVGSNSGTVENSYIEEGYVKLDTGALEGGAVGGLVASNSGTVRNSYAIVNVSGEGPVGGLVGGSSGTVRNSYARGDVSGERIVGGLVGNNFHIVENSYAFGDVSGDECVGGLIGRVGFEYDKSEGEVINSYSTGEVSGNDDDTVGGLVGTLEWGEVNDAFWDVETSGQDDSDGGTGKSTEEMKDVATFTDTETEGLEEPWDFVGDPYDDESNEDIWDIDEDEEINDGYPFLTGEDEEEDLRIESFELENFILGEKGIVELVLRNDGEEVFESQNLVFNTTFLDVYGGKGANSFWVWYHGGGELTLQEDEISIEIPDLDPGEQTSIEYSVELKKDTVPSLYFADTLEIKMRSGGEMVDNYRYDELKVGLSPDDKTETTKTTAITVLQHLLKKNLPPGTVELTEVYVSRMSENVTDLITSIKERGFEGTAEEFLNLTYLIWPTVDPQFTAELVRDAAVSYLESGLSVSRSLVWLYDTIAVALEKNFPDLAEAIQSTIPILLWIKCPVVPEVENLQTENKLSPTLNEIPEGRIEGIEDNDGWVLWLPKTGEYELTLQGTETGTVNFYSLTEVDDEIVVEDAEFDVEEDEVGRVTMTPGSYSEKIEIDEDGDGEIDKYIEMDSTPLSEFEPEEDKDEDETDWLPYMGIGIIALIVFVIAGILIKRRGKSDLSREEEYFQR